MENPINQKGDQINEPSQTQAKVYSTDMLARYAKIVTDGIIEGSHDDRAVQGKAMDQTIKIENMTIIRFISSDNKGGEKETASISLTGSMIIKTEEKKDH